MLTWIYNILIGNLCKHQWETKEGHMFLDVYERRPMRNVVQTCKHCGKIREQKIGA